MADSFKEAIAEVKIAYDLPDYIQFSGVNLKSAGGASYKGLCPFHKEKSPSFTVNSHFQNYKCFGCGEHGDIIGYVEKTENLSFIEAVRKLAEDKNIELNFGDEKQTGVDYESLRECLKETANFFVSEFRKLDPSHPARTEITDRGLSIKKTLYGYAPEKRTSLYSHLKSKKFDEETMIQAGVVSKFQDKHGKDFYSDFWSGRLMFIITDVTGKPIGFSGKKLYETDKRGKYVNSPDGPLFDKSSALYNLANAKKKAGQDKKVYVNEGQFDVSALVEIGEENTVASSGTAFTEKQGLILRRLVSDEGKIVFCFDPDSAGIEAVKKVFQNVPLIHGQSEVVLLDPPLDPSDYRKEHGNEALLAALQNTVPMIKFVLDRELEKFDMSDNLETMKYVEAAARILRSVSNLILREQYTKEVALESFVSLDEVRSAIEKAKPLGEGAAAPRNSSAEDEESEEVEEPRYKSESEEAAEANQRLFQLMEDSEQHLIASRLVALALQNRGYLESLKKIHKLLPPEFYPLLKEYSSLDPDSRVIPELFTNVELAEKLIVNSFFPFSADSSEEMNDSLFLYLVKRLKNHQDVKMVRAVRRETMSKLGKDPSVSAEFMERAIIFEQKKLEALAAKTKKEEVSQ